MGSSQVFVYEEGGEFYNSLLQASLDCPDVFKDVLNTEIKNAEFVVNRHCFHISKRVASYMDLNMLRAVKSIFGLSKWWICMVMRDRKIWLWMGINFW